VATASLEVIFDQIWSVTMKWYITFAALAVMLVVASACLGAVSAEEVAAVPLVVRTQLGRVQGVQRHDVLEYRGIPYAAPPVGARRFALPHRAAAWGAVRDASAFGPACPQQARFHLTDASSAEDCLTLNVSVPLGTQVGARLPVLFYIHGGAYVGGSSNLYRLDKLARLGKMVVVSVNYRLGVLGFMPHPAFASHEHLNGNYGLEDQRFALQWVQENIAAFGGNPLNVTIAGESAGAASVCMHLASPEHTKGLFQKALIISVGCLQPVKTVAMGLQTGLSVASMLGCTGSSSKEVRHCMQHASIERILSAQGSYSALHPTELAPFAPVVGTRDDPNATVPRAVSAALTTGHFATVPLMMGGARDELRLYVGYWWQAWKADPTRSPALDAANFDAVWLPLLYPEGADLTGQSNAARVSAEYTPAGGWSSLSDASVPEALGELMSDFTPAMAINNCLYLHTADAFRAYAQARSLFFPLYEYEFSDPDAPVMGVGIAKPYPPFAMGPVHSAMLNYLFPQMSNTKAIDAPELPASAESLGDQMVYYIAQFMRSATTEVAGLPVWPVYGGGPTVMNFVPDNSQAYDANRQHHCAFWADLYPDRLGSLH
jgi:para-nitrobenzyl esterase